MKFSFLQLKKHLCISWYIALANFRIGTSKMMLDAQDKDVSFMF